jgi:hypothetical protein
VDLNLPLQKATAASICAIFTAWYGLDGPGIESRWGGRDFSRPSRLGRPPGLLYSRYRVSFTGVKRLGRAVLPPPPHIERRCIRKSRDITLLPFCALVACCRVTFTFTCYLRYAACEYLLGLFIALQIRTVDVKPLQ